MSSFPGFFNPLKTEEDHHLNILALHFDLEFRNQLYLHEKDIENLYKGLYNIDPTNRFASQIFRDLLAFLFENLN